MADQQHAIGTLHFDAGLLPPEARFAAWCSALSNFDLSRREDMPFFAVADVWMLGPLILTHATVDPLRYERTRDRIARDANDHLALVYLVSGRFLGNYGGGERLSEPGSLSILDMRRPCWTDAGRLEAFIVSVARPLIMARIGAIDPHGLVVNDGTARLLGTVLHGIAREAPTLAVDHAGTLTTILLELLIQTIVDGGRTQSAAHSERTEALLSRARAIIDQNLDRNLDAAAICGALGVSRSALYRAFEAGGGVQHQVQRQRVMKLKACLADPGDARSIGNIVEALGFADKSHATRAFKREFGCTPGEYRRDRKTAAEHAYADIDGPRLFESWTSTLD